MTAALTTELIADLKRRRRDLLLEVANECQRNASWLARLAYRASTTHCTNDIPKLDNTGIVSIDTRIAKIDSLTETLDWIAQEQANAEHADAAATVLIQEHGWQANEKYCEARR